MIDLKQQFNLLLDDIINDIQLSLTLINNIVYVKKDKSYVYFL